MIYTFYSFKGGVGRSMALANVAELLYSRGLRVLMVDFDLEAPGLERYFDVDGAKHPPEEVINKRGVIDLLFSYKDLRSLPLPEAPQATASTPDADSFPFPVEPISSFIVPIYEQGKNGGTLSIMPAGRRAGREFTRYAERVRSFGWDDFYAKLDGELFFEWFRRTVTAKDLFDIVLVDSRTGVTEMSGVCTYQLADVVIMCVAPNYQNLDGSLKLAKSLARPELVEQGRKGRALSLLFVPSRVEQGLGTKLDEFKERFDEAFSGLTPKTLKFKKSAFIDLMVPYTLDYAFAEDVAVREPDSPKAVYLIESFEKMIATMAQLEPETSPLAKLYAPKDEVEKQIKLAEEVFAQFKSNEQELARKLFIQLVRPSPSNNRGEDSRLQVTMSGLDEQTRQIARKLNEVRLVVIERDGSSNETVQVAQEALIRQWERLHGWVDQDLQFLQWRQRLQGNMAEWEEKKNSGAALLTGVSLKTAKIWRAIRDDVLTAPERLYIDASLQRQRRKIIGNVIVYASAALLLAIVFVWQRPAPALIKENAALAAEYNKTGLELISSSPDSAIDSFNRAIELKADFAEAYVNRGNAHVVKGDYDSAFPDFDKAIKLKPDDAQAYYDVGAALAKKGNLDGALSSLNKAIQLNVNYAEAYKVRAAVYLRKGKPDEAVDDLGQAVELDPKDPTSFSNRGLALAQMKKYDLALTDYTRAIELKPDYAEAYLNRGLTYKSKGDKDSAIANLQIASKFTNDEQISSQVNKALIELGTRAPSKIRVYLQFSDAEDLKIVDSIGALLNNKGYKTVSQLNSSETSGDVRFYHEEDKQTAEDVRGVVKNALSAIGLKLNIRSVSLVGRFPKVTRGHIEVWLPPLYPSASQQKDPANSKAPFKKTK